MSIAAACVLIAVKLVTGLATHSLGLLSEAAHSGTDLIAALLTFFAIGVAIRAGDPGHQYGHGQARPPPPAGRGTLPRRRESDHRLPRADAHLRHDRRSCESDLVCARDVRG